MFYCIAVRFIIISLNTMSIFLPVVVNNNNTSNNKRPLGCRQIYYLQNNNKQDAKESDPSFDCLHAQIDKKQKNSAASGALSAHQAGTTRRESEKVWMQTCKLQLNVICS